MKRTVFYEFHRQAGGKLVPFAGYEMPVEFSGVKNEHNTVRRGSGIFDVSHMGEIWISGEGASDFVQKITSNDIRKLSNGKILYSCMPNDTGGIVDDLLVYQFDSDRFLLVVNASNIEKDWAWMVKNNVKNVTMKNESDSTSQLAVQGPDAIRVLQKLTDIDLSKIPYYTFVVGSIAGKKDIIISNTGYTGAGGFEIYMKNDDGPALMKSIMEAGVEFNILPVGLAARDTLRLEMGFCLYGNDIDDNTGPLEAGLGWITKPVDGNDFIGKDLVLKMKEEGIKRKLTGFIMQDRAIPRKDYKIVNETDEEIGHVTSGTLSPYTGLGIGLGYLKVPYNQVGSQIFIQIRNKNVPAMVTTPPFLKTE